MKKWTKIILSVLAVLAIGLFIVYSIFIKAHFVDEPLLDGFLKEDSIASLKRSFLWYKPKSTNNVNTILFVFHGSKGDGKSIRQQTSYGFDKLADKENFIVIYPNGYFNHWNDCRASASYKANTDDVDDITFLKEIEQKIQNELNIKFDNEFAVGYSNGGHFCFKLALEAPDWIDGIAAISANLPVDANLDCKKSNQFVPILLCNGTEDKINPYQGGLVEIFGDTSRGMVLSTDLTIDYFRKIGKLPSDSKKSDLPDINKDDNSTVEMYKWKTGTSQKIVLYKIIGGGHTIPNLKSKFPKILGNTNNDVNMPEFIWQFFKSNSK